MSLSKAQQTYFEKAAQNNGKPSLHGLTDAARQEAVRILAGTSKK